MNFGKGNLYEEKVIQLIADRRAVHGHVGWLWDGKTSSRKADR